MPKDLPIAECQKRAAPFVARGAQTYQKFTCCGCGSRQTIDEPNKWYETGTCGECGATTNIANRGCGFTLVYSF